MLKCGQAAPNKVLHYLSHGEESCPTIHPWLRPHVYHIASMHHHLHARKQIPDKLALGQVATRPLTAQNEVGSRRQQVGRVSAPAG